MCEATEYGRSSCILHNNERSTEMKIRLVVNETAVMYLEASEVDEMRVAAEGFGYIEYASALASILREQAPYAIHVHTFYEGTEYSSVMSSYPSSLWDLAKEIVTRSAQAKNEIIAISNVTAIHIIARVGEKEHAMHIESDGKGGYNVRHVDNDDADEDMFKTYLD